MEISPILKGGVNMEIVVLIAAIIGLVTAVINLVVSIARKKKDHRSDKR